MIKVKLESADDNIPHSSNPLTSNNEDEVPNSIKTEIKEENELIIEPELMLLPIKLEDEQQEYYQQSYDIDEEYGNYILPTAISDAELEEFSIEFIDEEYSDDEDNSIENDYEDNDSDMDGDDNMDDITNKELSEGMNDNIASGSSTKETLCKRTFLKWLCGDYIKHKCPVCTEKLKNYELWCKHIEDQHKDLIDDTKATNYHFHKNSQAICKQCNKQFKHDYAVLIHSLRHSSQDVLNIVVCNLCTFESSKPIYIQSHIMEHHPDILELYKTQDITTNMKTFECPLCRAIFKSYTHIRHHFIDNHPKENSEKYKYDCHLCPFSIDTYDNVNKFYEHLLEEHNFKDWKLMNFRQMEENSDDQHYSCTICLKIFTDLDTTKFLQHHLEHDNNSYWSCRTCNKKRSFRLHTCYHMCSKLFRRLKNSGKKSNKKQSSTLSSACTSEDKKELTNWQEFEEYVKHICPFCNIEFDGLQKWQMHLRKIHLIDTLKGLEMKPCAEDNNKLQCNICNTLIINSSVQLHTHRFQHLPFKPYKCRHCLKSLTNYKIALTHVLNKCQAANEETFKGLLLNKHKNFASTVKEFYKVICPLCKVETFQDDEGLWQHYGIKHNNLINYYSQQLDNSFVCNICQKPFAIYDKNLCVSHMLQHFDEKPYKCLKCDISFHTRKGCKNHVYHHFAIPLNLDKSHIESLTLNRIENLYSSTANLEINKARVGRCTEKSLILNEFVDYITYACPECNESLETQQMWHDHINNKHSFFNVDTLSLKDPIDGTHKCMHCNLKISSSLVQRQKHKLIHMPHKAFICSLCFHRCNSLGVLYGHLRRIHFSKGCYKCAICSVVLTTPYERAEHLKNTHPRSEWPTSTCLVCYKTYSSNTSLKHHMLVHDINRPKFECEYCGAKIIEKKDFKIHVGRHLKAMAATNEPITKTETPIEKTLCEEVKNDEEDLLEKSPMKRRKIDESGKFCK